jgi:hypothetical protein
MASKKSVVTVADEVTSVEIVDVATDSSVVEVDSAAMVTVDEVEVVVEEVLVEAAAQRSPELLAHYPSEHWTPHAGILLSVIPKAHTCNLSLLFLQHRRRMLRYCICVMMAG